MSEPCNPKDKVGAKKVDLGKIPAAGAAHTALALMYGAGKYGPYNWRHSDKKVGYMTYLSAILRHTWAFIDGEDVASDSLVSHLGHVAAGCMVLLDAIECQNAIDDRPPNGQDILEKLNKDLPGLLDAWKKDQ